MFDFLLSKWFGGNAATASRLFSGESGCRKALIILLLAWSILWLVAPLAAVPGVYFDVAENIEWGRYWQCGYDKHPFLSMWITRAAYLLTGMQETMYLLNVVSISAAVWCTWRLARKFLAEPTAMVAALMPLFLSYFSSRATEFNNDVIALSTWAAAALFFYNALADDRIRDWLLTALFCAAAMMTKYYAAVLCASMALVILTTGRGHRAFRRPGLYLAAGLFLLLIAPNVIWLINTDFLPFRYIQTSAHLEELESAGPIAKRLGAVWDYLQVILGAGAPLAAFCALFCTGRREETAKTDDRAEARRFLTIMAWGPLALTLLVPLLSGGRIKTSWLASCFTLLPLWLLVMRPVRISDRTVYGVFAALSIFALTNFGIFFYQKSVRNTYRKPGATCAYEAYPGREIARQLTSEWHQNFPGRKLRYVIAPRKDGVFFALHSPDNPSAFYEANLSSSPWIDPDDLRRQGAVVVWEIDPRDEETTPKWVAELRQYAGFRELPPRLLPREAPGWVPRLSGKAPCTVTIGAAFLAPQE